MAKNTDSIHHINKQTHRECAGKGCNNHAENQLKICYVEKYGWFCEDCKELLLKEGLIVEMRKSLEHRNKDDRNHNIKRKRIS